VHVRNKTSQPYCGWDLKAPTYLLLTTYYLLLTTYYCGWDLKALTLSSRNPSL
jgi:hypothetical protein